VVKLNGFVLALTVALVVAAPAAAKEKAPVKELVPVTGSGMGIAPGAPEWVTQHVAEVTESNPSVVRSMAGVRRKAATGCRSVWAYRGYNHWLGYVLFRYYEQVSWCSNGFRIYSFGRDRWPETHAGWQFNGHIGSSITGGPHSYSRTAWTQGAFSFCLAACYDHKYPWVNIYVNVDLGWDANTGG